MPALAREWSSVLSWMRDMADWRKLSILDGAAELDQKSRRWRDGAACVGQGAVIMRAT
jgi:hypothetical protein